MKMKKIIRMWLEHCPSMLLNKYNHMVTNKEN